MMTRQHEVRPPLRRRCRRLTPEASSRLIEANTPGCCRVTPARRAYCLPPVPPAPSPAPPPAGALGTLTSMLTPPSAGPVLAPAPITNQAITPTRIRTMIAQSHAALPAELVCTCWSAIVSSPGSALQPRALWTGTRAESGMIALECANRAVQKNPPSRGLHPADQMGASARPETPSYRRGTVTSLMTLLLRE